MQKYNKYYPEGWEWRPARVFKTERSLVYGIGVNDAPYSVQPRVNGKHLKCPAYVKWKGMLERVGCPKFHAKQTSYIGTEVCESWIKFMGFREWFFTKMLKTPLTTGEAHLDKDLLSGLRRYSPETCSLVPRWLNNLSGLSGVSRGDYPIGVSPNGNGFQTKVSLGATKFSAWFKTVEEAADAYKRVKLEHVKTIELPKWLPQRKLRKRLIEIVTSQT